MIHDYIIVGSGVAGATVARQILQKDPLTRILMLEAGPIPTLKDRRLWWNYVRNDIHPYNRESADETSSKDNGTSTGKTVMEIQGSRLLTYGGSTVHWGGWSLRLKPEDFKMKTNTQRGIDWPISYEDLSPYYTQAENYLSVSGDRDDPSTEPYPMPPFGHVQSDKIMIKGFEKLDWSYGKMPIARYRKCMRTGTCKYCPIGARFSASYILDGLVNQTCYPNFSIRTNSAVRRVITDVQGVVTGLEVIERESDKTKNKERVPFFVSANKVILACGTIETPKLLLASRNETFPRGLGNQGDQVGRNFVVHPFLYVRGSLKALSGQTAVNPDMLQQEYDFPTLMSREFDDENNQKRGKLFMFKSRSRPKSDLRGMMKKGHTCDQIIKEISKKAEFEIQAFVEDFPNPENRVTLKEDTYDRFGLPVSEISYSQPPDFEETSNYWLKKMEELLRAMDCQPFKSAIRSPRADHAGGTCRMSDSPMNGVVDSDLKVFGTQNLYIISNAVFPNLGAVNPTLTLTALSFRLSNHLNAL